MKNEMGRLEKLKAVLARLRNYASYAQDCGNKDQDNQSAWAQVVATYEVEIARIEVLMLTHMTLDVDVHHE